MVANASLRIAEKDHGPVVNGDRFPPCFPIAGQNVRERRVGTDSVQNSVMRGGHSLIFLCKCHFSSRFYPMIESSTALNYRDHRAESVQGAYG